MKRYLGQLKRAARGYIENAREKPALPTDLKPSVLAKSESGQEINLYKIGNGPKKVLFVSAIHGNETGTVKLAYELISYLNQSLETWKDFTFYIVPCLNIDGYTLALKSPDYSNGGRIGRFNARNVDLNRNFPTKDFQPKSDWTHGKNYQDRTEVYCGESGNSEKETRALTELIKTEGIQVFIAFHSAGKDVLGNDTSLGQELAKEFGQQTGYRICDLEEWKKLHQTGTAKAWCDEKKIAYIEIEAASRWGSDWRNQDAGIKQILMLLKNRRSL